MADQFQAFLVGDGPQLIPQLSDHGVLFGLPGQRVGRPDRLEELSLGGIFIRLFVFHAFLVQCRCV